MHVISARLPSALAPSYDSTRGTPPPGASPTSYEATHTDTYQVTHPYCPARPDWKFLAVCNQDLAVSGLWLSSFEDLLMNINMNININIYGFTMS